MQIELLKEEEAALLKNLIGQSDKIVICCHQNPDGDALGSCLALGEYLKQHGKTPKIAVPDAYPDFLQWLPDSQTIVRYDKHKETVEEALANAELVFCLDFNRADRLGTEMSSTCELLFRVIWQLGGFEEMTKKEAVQIYCGMMTDTGGFTFNSSRPEIFFIISQLLTKGFDKDKIYRNVFNNYSEWRMRLMGYVLYQKMRVFQDHHASYFTISRQDFKRFHFIKGDAEGLVNLPLQIKGMRLSISLREDSEKENLVWVSLRSVGSFPCNKIAEKFFNGGGHLNASGGRLYCSLEEAEKIAEKAIAASDEKL